MTRKGKQVEISAALSEVTRRFDHFAGGALVHERLLAAWESAAGEAVSTHTADVRLEQGVLRVSVDSPIWATELSALSEQYRLRVNEEMGKEAVTEIRFSVSRAVSRRKKEERSLKEGEAFYSPAPVEPIALTELEQEQIESAASEIEDPRLRMAVLAAITADLRRKKGLEAMKTRERAPEGF